MKYVTANMWLPIKTRQYHLRDGERYIMPVVLCPLGGVLLHCCSNEPLLLYPISGPSDTSLQMFSPHLRLLLITHRKRRERLELRHAFSNSLLSQIFPFSFPGFEISFFPSLPQIWVKWSCVDSCWAFVLLIQNAESFCISKVKRLSGTYTHFWQILVHCKYVCFWHELDSTRIQYASWKWKSTLKWHFKHLTVLFLS